MKIMYSESEQKLQRQKKSELKAEWKKLKLVIRYIFTALALRILVIIVAVVLFDLYFEEIADWFAVEPSLNHIEVR